MYIYIYRERERGRERERERELWGEMTHRHTQAESLRINCVEELENSECIEVNIDVLLTVG